MSDTETPTEITPAMVEAGVIAFANWDERFSLGPEEMVANVFRAMLAAKVNR